MATILYGERTTELPNARAEGDALWLPIGELQAAIGWDLKDEGVCASEVCVPIPEGQSWLDGDRFDLAAFAHHLGQPVARDDASETWAFGEAAPGPASATVEAPDFTLPDLEGRLHSLSDHRGKKVLIVTWASW